MGEPPVQHWWHYLTSFSGASHITDGPASAASAGDRCGFGLCHLFSLSSLPLLVCYCRALRSNSCGSIRSHLHLHLSGGADKLIACGLANPTHWMKHKDFMKTYLFSEWKTMHYAMMNNCQILLLYLSHDHYIILIIKWGLLCQKLIKTNYVIQLWPNVWTSWK